MCVYVCASEGRPGMSDVSSPPRSGTPGLSFDFTLLSPFLFFCLVLLLFLSHPFFFFPLPVPRGSPSHGGDVVVYVFDKPTKLAHSFLFCSCDFFCLMVLSAVLHSINSPNNSPLSHSVLPVLFLPDWSFQLYISL